MKLNQQALIAALHEYRRCSEDQARGIISEYLKECPAFIIIVCPGCEKDQLNGALRGRCRYCNTYYSRDEERPDDRERTPVWWRRNRDRYPTPGVKIKVVQAQEDV